MGPVWCRGCLSLSPAETRHTAPASAGAQSPGSCRLRPHTTFYFPLKLLGIEPLPKWPHPETKAVQSRVPRARHPSSCTLRRMPSRTWTRWRMRPALGPCGRPCPGGRGAESAGASALPGGRRPEGAGAPLRPAPARLRVRGRGDQLSPRWQGGGAGWGLSPRRAVSAGAGHPASESRNDGGWVDPGDTAPGETGRSQEDTLCGPTSMRT